MSDDLVKRLREAFVDFDDMKDAADRIEELEAKLAKAVEALRQIEQGWVDEADPDPGVSIQVNMAADEMEDIARTTLAELKG